MTEAFKICVEHVLNVEGGFSDHPHDRGGATNFGITQGALTAFFGRPVSVEEVKNLTRDVAAKIYYAMYWRPLRLDGMPLNVARILFDLGVNGGVATAARTLQTVLNELLKGLGGSGTVKVDGVIGVNTIAAVSFVSERKLCLKMIQAIQKRYARICLSNPSQLVFLEGWLNRSFVLQDSLAL